MLLATGMLFLAVAECTEVSSLRAGTLETFDSLFVDFVVFAFAGLLRVQRN